MIFLTSGAYSPRVFFVTSFLFLIHMPLSLVRVKFSALEHRLGSKPKYSWCSLKTTGECRTSLNWHGPEARAGVRDLCYINAFRVTYHRTKGNISWHSSQKGFCLQKNQNKNQAKYWMFLWSFSSACLFVCGERVWKDFGEESFQNHFYRQPPDILRHIATQTLH